MLNAAMQTIPKTSTFRGGRAAWGREEFWKALGAGRTCIQKLLSYRQLD